MKKITFLVLSLLVYSIVSFAQSKEEKKLNKYIEKGKIEKAQSYFDKIEGDLPSYRKSGLEEILFTTYLKQIETYIDDNRLKEAQNYYNSIEPHLNEEYVSEANELLFKEYMDKKDYSNALECTKKCDNSYYLYKLANVYYDKNSEYYDLEFAIKLYRKAGNDDKLATIYLYDKNDPKKASRYCKKSCLRLGNELFEEGKVAEAIMFYRKTKEWRKRQSILDKEPHLKTKVLDYCYKNKKYLEAYNINKRKRRYAKDMLDDSHAVNFTAYKIFDNGATIEEVKNFLTEIEVEDELKNRILLLGLISSKRFDEADELFFSIPEENHKQNWKFLANNLKKTREGHSLFKANLARKLNEDEYIIKQALYDYINYEIDKHYFKKWDRSSENVSVFKEFRNTLGPNFEANGYTLSEFMVDEVLVKSSNRLKNLIGYNQNKYQDAKNVFDFVSKYTIWCAKGN